MNHPLLTGPSAQHRWRRLVLLLCLITPGVFAEQLNGFEVGNATVPVDEIRRGGPPRDGIPALSDPSFEPPAEVSLWRPDDRVLVVDVDGVSFAYPVGILNWHEIVDHRANGQPVLVTYCPLCGTGIAFNPNVDGRRLTFGVSGLLYNSDLLMYDHQTESLWSQLLGEAIAGPLAGTRLERLPLRHMLWKSWRASVDNGRVLSADTGYGRDYQRSPYGDYDQSARLYFPVSETSRKYHPKTWVVGYIHDGESKAWPFPELEKTRTPVDGCRGRPEGGGELRPGCADCHGQQRRRQTAGFDSGVLVCLVYVSSKYGRISGALIHPGPLALMRSAVWQSRGWRQSARKRLSDSATPSACIPRRRFSPPRSVYPPAGARTGRR